jgi:hypothetical protein
MAVRHRVYRRHPWQRFTLLDMLLLQASFALGFSLVRSVDPARAEGVRQVITAVVFGAVLAGPVILLTQWTLRRRSRPLSAGEWLWLSPLVLFFVLWCASEIPSAWWSEFLFGAWVFAQVNCFGATLATLLSGLRGYRDTVPCYWTDRTGSWVSVLFGLWVVSIALPAILLS